MKNIDREESQATSTLNRIFFNVALFSFSSPSTRSRRFCSPYTHLLDNVLQSGSIVLTQSFLVNVAHVAANFFDADKTYAFFEILG